MVDYLVGGVNPSDIYKSLRISIPQKKNKLKHVPKHQPDYEIPIVLRHYSPSTSIIHIPSDSHPPFFWAIRWKEKRQVTLRLPQAKTTWGDEERGDKLENAPDFS